MGSNNSYWGDIESSEDLDLATLDEVVLTDHGFTLSGFIDKVQDAVFDGLYSSDSPMTSTVFQKMQMKVA
jgi:hypothetical protein